MNGLDRLALLGIEFFEELQRDFLKWHPESIVTWDSLILVQPETTLRHGKVAHMLLWKFERSVLRPLQIAPLLVAVPCLVAKEWWALLACAIFAFLVGGIGQSIHPLQSAKNLAQGPTQSRAAVLEAATLDISAQSALVQRACTKVAMLIGATLFSALLAYGDLRWYWAVPVSWAVMIFSGAVLKMRFARESLSL